MNKSMIYKRKVKIFCHLCKQESNTIMTFGEDTRYPDDFSLNCPKCDNWEEGSLPTQSFDILEQKDIDD